MKCFHCGNRLGKGDVCLTCGQDVRLFKKILAASWQYYDEGLKKAQARDLSGAIEDLKNSLLLYKENTQARDLLGLVYYEMGEIGQAVIEWVISLNMDPGDDRASDLLDKVQKNQVVLERGSLSIRKYNQALHYAQNGNEDLAVLRLNSVLKDNPHMVKAGLLMALLQMKEGHPENAERYIRGVLKVDRHNVQALQYQEALTSKEIRKNSEKEKSIVSKDAEVRRHLSGDDVIVPTYKENQFGWQTIAGVAGGAVLGAALVAYLIMPSRISSLKSDFNQTLASYNERLSAKEAVIAAGEDEIEELNERISKLENNVQTADSTMASVVTEYGKLLDANEALLQNEYLQAAALYLSIDPSVVTDENFRESYTALQTEFTENGYDVLYPAGTERYNRRKYAEATEYYKVCLALRPDSTETKYWLAASYVNQGVPETAVSYLEDIIQNHADEADWAAAASALLAKIQ